MKKIYKLMLLLTLGAGTFSFAQTGVIVTYYDGNVQNFTVADAGKLYFESDNLYVKTDVAATPTTIPVSIIRKITFSNTLAIAGFGENKDHLALFPNPGNDVIRISSDSPQDLKTSIYNLTGQRVHQGIYKPGQDIDVSALQSGLYLVQVNGVTIKFSKK